MAENDEEEKTRLIRRSKPEGTLSDARTLSDSEASITELTRVLPSEPEGEVEMTQLVGPARKSVRAEPAPEANDDAGEVDPVVGWLVVLAGPGRGNARRLGYGQNTIGRDKGERVPLNFGDSSISRSKHCFLIYEPRKRQYLLRPGDGSNLTYVNGELVSETRGLEANSVIEIGATRLKFVPLCGPDFDWEEQTPAAK